MYWIAADIQKILLRNINTSACRRGFFILNIMNETFKDIPGYEGYYQINKFGIIKSLKRIIIRGKSSYPIKEKILKPGLGSNGYLLVALTKNGIKKHISVHRLVGKVFIPNPKNKPEINHKNGIKIDCWRGNLEWATSSENQKHAFKTGLKNATWWGKFGKDHNKSKTVLQFGRHGGFIMEFGSVREAERITGIDNRQISNVCNREINHTAGGFIWKFK